MEPKTGLLIWWILTMILGMTCRPTDRTVTLQNNRKCDVIHRIDVTKHRMKVLLNTFNIINKNPGPWMEPISELDLKNLTHKEKLHKAQCGLHYMEQAVEMIRKHQDDLHAPVTHIPNSIATDLDRTRECVKHAIGHCKNKTKPEFSYPHTYERKQWGGTVLNISVDFLDELVKVIEHEMSKSHKSNNHSINTA
ncbi:uncharacterized protein osm [Megalobrama amblycephala]|uniref:uncharacterized protein osm n=1 Tax=Megalobrama amblycephala TaxID=75352 RepID=UPI002014557B|nr:uncharacterized protein osm [Megalobrama amblycephala]